MPFDRITSIELVQTNMICVSTDRGKDYKLCFYDTKTAEEAFRIIRSVKANKTADLPGQTAAELSYARAQVVMPQVAQSWSELNLVAKNIILVIMQDGSPVQQDGKWLGEAHGCRGWFPRGCVELIQEPSHNAELTNSGYKSLRDLPTIQDWHAILLGGQVKTFQPGEKILSSVDYSQKLYQVVSGQCTLKSKNRVLDRFSENDTFGEVAFLLGGCHSAIEVEASGIVEIYILEAEYLKRLFNQNPILGGRFFKYLATVLERRLRAQEASFC